MNISGKLSRREALKGLATIVGMPFIGQRLVWSAEPRGNVYYVSPSGSDTNDGKTPQTAWQTLESIRRLDSGDVCSFEANKIFSGTLRISASGILKHPIKFTTYGSGGIAEISATETDKPAIYIPKSCNLIEISGLRLSSKGSYGILCIGEGDGQTDLKIKEVEFRNCKRGGYNSTNPRDYNITLENCTIDNVGGSAIEFHGKSITLRGNHIRGNGIKPAIGLYGVQKAIIENNEVSTAVAPKPIFLEMDRKPMSYIADWNKWNLPRGMYEGFLVGKQTMSLSEFKRFTGQHANDNRPGAGPTQALQTPQGPGQAPVSTQTQPTYQTPQGLVDPRTQPGWNGMNRFMQWRVYSAYTNSLEQLKPKK